MASFGGLSEDVVDTGECFLGVDEYAGASVFAYEYRAVGSAISSIAGGKHRAIPGHGGVMAYEFELRAFAAVGLSEEKHLAGVLVTLDDPDGVGAFRKAGIGVLEGGAHLLVLGAEGAFDVVLPVAVAYEDKIHGDLAFNI